MTKGLTVLFSAAAATTAAADAAHAVRGSNGVTPIQKVAEMLDGMVAKGKQEKHTEETEFASFQQWCDSTRASTKHSIEDGAMRIQQLEADIIKAEADAEDAGATAEDTLAKADAEQSEADKASAIRKKEKADYDATHADLSESIDAVERAVSTLKSRAADVPQSLMQIRDTLHLPYKAQSAIEALLAESNGQAPQANAYEFQSSSVVDLLGKLRLKFQDELLAVQKAELSAKGNFEVLLQRLTDSIKNRKERAAQKTAFKAKRLEDAALSKGDLSMAQKAKTEDESTLSDTLADCDARSREFEANQVVRAGEIKACESALEILRSDAVAGNADKHLPGALVQDGDAAVSLAQLRGKEVPESRQKVIEFLEGRAKDLGSRYLALAATHVANDPFEKVKQMVKDLIVKLMEEANSEADHNSYCTTELATNKLTRENKQTEVDELTANVEKKTAEGQQLASALAKLSEEIADLKQQQAEAVDLRSVEKKTNMATIADAKEAQVAVTKATKILKDFFAQAADASLLQNNDGINQEMSQALQAPYQGQQSGSTGIIGFLDVILSDFARLETETSSAEEQAQEVHDKFMAETNQDLAVKDTESKHKDNSKNDCDQSIASLSSTLKLTQEELDASVNYYEKLKPSCVDSGLSYEERVQKRQEEIVSLQEAMKILSQEDLS